jgi:retron-type reverse transcriptase
VEMITVTWKRYADDSVIICKNRKSANHAMELLKYIMGKLDLTLHPRKTKIVCMWDGKEGFDFLSANFNYQFSLMLILCG